MRSGVSHKKQPPEMSITGGRNSPIDKGGGLLAGGRKSSYSLSHPIALCVSAYQLEGLL